MILNEIAPRGLVAIVHRHADRAKKAGLEQKAKQITTELRMPFEGMDAIERSVAIHLLLATMSMAELGEENKTQLFKVLVDMVKDNTKEQTDITHPTIRSDDLIERIRFMLGVA